jgi:hypothetical protein
MVSNQLLSLFPGVAAGGVAPGGVTPGGVNEGISGGGWSAVTDGTISAASMS